MNLGDLIPNPVNLIKGPLEAPFKSRDGHPWLQSTARNLGHASFGDTIGNYVDQNYLGDPAPGATTPSAPSPGPVNNPSTQAMQLLIQQWLQRKQ